MRPRGRPARGLRVGDGPIAATTTQGRGAFSFFAARTRAEAGSIGYDFFPLAPGVCGAANPGATRQQECTHENDREAGDGDGPGARRRRGGAPTGRGRWCRRRGRPAVRPRQQGVPAQGLRGRAGALPGVEPAGPQPQRAVQHRVHVQGAASVPGRLPLLRRRPRGGEGSVGPRRHRERDARHRRQGRRARGAVDPARRPGLPQPQGPRRHRPHPGPHRPGRGHVHRHRRGGRVRADAEPADRGPPRQPRPGLARPQARGRLGRHQGRARHPGPRRRRRRAGRVYRAVHPAAAARTAPPVLHQGGLRHHPAHRARRAQQGADRQRHPVGADRLAAGRDRGAQRPGRGRRPRHGLRPDRHQQRADRHPPGPRQPARLPVGRAHGRHQGQPAVATRRHHPRAHPPGVGRLTYRGVHRRRTGLGLDHLRPRARELRLPDHHGGPARHPRRGDQLRLHLRQRRGPWPRPGQRLQQPPAGAVRRRHPQREHPVPAVHPLRRPDRPRRRRPHRGRAWPRLGAVRHRRRVRRRQPRAA